VLLEKTAKATIISKDPMPSDGLSGQPEKADLMLFDPLSKELPSETNVPCNILGMIAMLALTNN